MHLYFNFGDKTTLILLKITGLIFDEQVWFVCQYLKKLRATDFVDQGKNYHITASVDSMCVFLSF